MNVLQMHALDRSKQLSAAEKTLASVRASRPTQDVNGGISATIWFYLEQPPCAGPPWRDVHHK